MTNEEATAQLKHEPVGTFLIRLSERVNGELVIRYGSDYFFVELILVDWFDSCSDSHF